jgi:hypothetical protein
MVYGWQLSAEGGLWIVAQKFNNYHIIICQFKFHTPSLLQYQIRHIIKNQLLSFLMSATSKTFEA